ncbi:NRDE-2, necessary for RNA interference-domain-containing protein [Aspergillus californicus]
MDSSGSQGKKAVPRFASFKPPPPPDGDRPSVTSREHTESEDKSKHYSKHRSRHRHHRERRSRSREYRRDRREYRRARKEDSRHDTERASEPTPSSNTLKEPSESSDLYVVDRKGDKYILVYGTVHRYSVPRYYRIGKGRVLGLSSKYRIERETIGENEIVVKSESRTDSSKSRAKRLLSGSEKLPSRLLRVRPTPLANDPIKSSEDFVPLKTSRKQDNTGTSDTDDDKFGYRSIHGKLKHDEGLPSDVEPMTDTESDGEGIRQDPDADLKQRNVELSRNVQQRPTDVEAWLQLVDHQATVLKGSAKQPSSLTSAEQNSLADIRLSIYEKALKKVGQGIGRDRLLIGLLEEGSKLWDTTKLLTQWHAILKANSQYIGLWMKYLDFRQTEFLNFSHARCLATFTECLALNKASSDNPDKVRVHMYLFLRLTFFLREAGYTEQATGLWQAVLESTFFRPQELDINTDEGLSAFTDFWDSEVARIGETGAKGWKNNTSALCDPTVFEPQCHLTQKSILASWSACERERILNAQLPARSLDEPEDDPYRVVLTSDLRDFLPLVSLPDSTSALVDSFLYFCHLPPIINIDNSQTTGLWMGDSFLRNDLGAAYANFNDWLPVPNAESGILSPTGFPQQYFIHNCDTYFADPDNWFSSLKTWVETTSNPACGVFRDWVRKSLRLLVEAMSSNEDLAEYTVAVEFVCNAKEAKKYAKSLLRKRPSSLRLYNSYALMERRAGNHAAADHVWATAISMSTSFADEQKIDNVLLWHTWIWELLEARNIALAAHLLVCMPQNNIDLKSFPEVSIRPAFSPANLLKIRSYLSEAQEMAIANRKPNIIKACTDCQSFLLYLTHAQDLSKSLETYNSTVTRLSFIPNSNSADTFKSYTTELLHQSRARLLYYHLRTTTLYKPSSIRNLLAESISLYPHNTIFLSLFAWNESRFRIEERVRDIMRDVTTRSQPHPSSSSPYQSQMPTQLQIPITTHLFSIYTELARPTYAGSTMHSARAAFERAINNSSSSSSSSSTSTSTSSNIPLWTLYILFNLSRHDITSAKSVFYRAIRACPWSKELLLLAFSHLREDVIREQHANLDIGSKVVGRGLGFHELRHVYNVLVEKELRIHVDIERELDDLAQIELESGARMPIDMPDDADASGDEVMQS